MPLLQYPVLLVGVLLCCSSQLSSYSESHELEPTLQNSPTEVGNPFPGDSFGCRTPYPEPWLCENFQVNGVDQGSFLWVRRPDSRYLLVAPHGRFDKGTAAIAYSIFPPVMVEGGPVWSQLVAHSFRSQSPSGLQHNVNRPSTLNLDVCSHPPELKVSQLVYQRFTEILDQLVQKPGLYFEIHGQDDPELKTTIEVATVRLSADQALKVREIMNQELDKAGIKGISVTIEPLDKVKYSASKAKICGSIQHIAPTPVIHSEIPKSMRQGEDAQLQTAQFFRALLNRLALEVFPSKSAQSTR